MPLAVFFRSRLSPRPTSRQSALPSLATRRCGLPQMVLAGLLLVSCSHGLAATCETPARLRFSLVPQGNVQQDLLALQPLFDAVQQALGIPVDVVMPTSYGSVVESLLAGTVDFARLGPAAYVSARRQDAGITPVATYTHAADGLHSADSRYYSVLVVKDGSRHQHLASLRGKTVALVDPGSTSGALIPRRVFADETRIPLDAFFSSVVYSGDHRKSLRAVAEQRVDAAFVSSTHFGKALASGEFPQAALRILWRSAPIPRDAFVLRDRLCAPLRQGIVATLLGADGRGIPALLRNLEATRFVAVTDADYQVLRDLPAPER